MKRILLFLLFFSGFFVFAQERDIAQDSLGPYRDFTFTELEESADIYYNRGDYQNSLRLNITLLKKALAEQNNYFIHQGYRNLGYDYLALRDTTLARESFQKATAYAKRTKNDTVAALTYMDLANLYSEIDSNNTKAFVYHDRSIEAFEQLKDSAGLADAHFNAIITALEAKNFQKAYYHILNARKLNEFKKHHFNHVGLDILTGEYYLAKENYVLADSYLQNAIAAAEEEQLPAEAESAYLALSKSLFAQDRFKEAYQARAKYATFLETNLRNINEANSETVSAKFQLSEYKKDVENAELKNQIQAEIVTNKSKLNTILIIVTACFLIVVIGLFVAFWKRKKLIGRLRTKNWEYLNAKKEAEKLALAKSNFFSTVSHELRTPLYGVIGLSTILLEDESLKNHEDDLKSLKFSADYLLALINDVLQLNKIDSKKLEEELSVFNVKRLVQTIVSSFEYMRLQNGNTILVSIGDNTPTSLRGYSVRLSQILMNLIGNACKFTENGEIHILVETVKKRQDSVTLLFQVKDTGIGIAEDKQESVFDEFSQVESQTYHQQGTGLGLPIVRKLLELSNSTIRLESELGVGSIFSFEIQYEIADISTAKEEPFHLDVQLLSGKSILVVEDNRINQIVTRKILEKNEMRCTLAENGQEGVTAVKQGDFDLVLMDINMPVMDGIEATKEIRKFNNSTPIIALTAVEVAEMRHEIYRAGMKDIIVKPYDVKKFNQTILKNLSASDGQNASLRAISS
ncbi:MAG: hybrid sensor histidine kinase/response regulator [Flavobacteriaceae bacterium]|nr:hybrid sensor histidine kinase/response regulator [Flavobacteriaceae bacterium]